MLDTLDALNELVVPAVADVCIVDALSGGELERLAVRVAGRDGDDVASALAARPPQSLLAFGDPEQPRLVADLDDAVLAQLAVDDEDLERLRALRTCSCLIVPLRARAQRLGSLTLIVTRRWPDLRQQGRGADARHDDAQQMLATPVEQIVDAYETTHEDGTPIDLDELPGRRLLAGELEPKPLVLRAVHRATGEEAWRVTKASGVYDREGRTARVHPPCWPWGA